MKIIKKFNVFVISVISVASALSALIFLWSTWENIDSDRMLLAGRARLSETINMQTQMIKDSEGKKIVSLDILSKENEDKDVQQENEKLANDAKKQDFSKFSFVAIGDTKSYGEVTGYNNELIAVLESASGRKPNFAIFVGDIISTNAFSVKGNKMRISDLKDLVEKYFNHYYITFGKHDIECGNQCVDAWKKIFFDTEVKSQEDRVLYHSFDYYNTHFVLLSSDYPEKHSVDSEQFDWLTRDLEKNFKANIIVVQHVSPITFFKEDAKQCHDMSCSPHIQNKLLDLYEKHGVDLVISGHENVFDYKIVRGIDFVLSGDEPHHKGMIDGDVYCQFFVNGEKILLKVFKINGGIVREIKIK